ncbi:MAG: HAMP domain-containing histidine kinase, partial [Candidatus Omnitrophica bacterium]|nr:HAMP domain-containing histidine kinase [Candidatus Omnitrophota bacterium]
RLGRIINDLLDISKIEAGHIDLHRQPVDLGQLVRKVVAAFEVKTRSGQVKLIAAVPEQPLLVYGDTDRIVQILVNLAGNSLKFTTEGHIKISIALQKNVVECQVQDTGIGIAPENLPKLFGRFQQFGRIVSGGEKGTGLGLAITRQLVELHQGSIRAESQVGKGTTFIFTLPRFSAEAVFQVHLHEAIQKTKSAETKFTFLHAPSCAAEDSVLRRLELAFSPSTDWKLESVIASPVNGVAVFLLDCNREAGLRAQTRLADLLGAPQGSVRAVTFPDDAAEEADFYKQLEMAR